MKTASAKHTRSEILSREAHEALEELLHGGTFDTCVASMALDKRTPAEAAYLALSTAAAMTDSQELQIRKALARAINRG